MGIINVLIIFVKVLARSYVDMLTWRETFRYNLNGEDNHNE